MSLATNELIGDWALFTTDLTNVTSGTCKNNTTVPDRTVRVYLQMLNKVNWHSSIDFPLHQSPKTAIVIFFHTKF